MSYWPPNLEGWELAPPSHAWQGFALHPASRPGAIPHPATCWIADEVAGTGTRDAWLDRIRLARNWDHPGLPRIQAGGTAEGRVWAVTSPVRRGSLWVFRTNMVLGDAEVEGIARQILEALCFAHERGVVHGAVGPDALLLERGVCRLAGLGLLDITSATRASWVDGASPPPAADLLALVPLLNVIAGSRTLTSARLLRVIEHLSEPGASAMSALAILGRTSTPSPTPVSPGPPASMRIGRYELLDQLAQGGMGVVWRARDPELDRIVAVKVHHPASVLPQTALARFRQEARAAGRLDHPAIVRILDFGSAPEGLFYAMEYVDGTDLAARLREVGRIDPHRAARWTASIARGLGHAHREGIVHRDLKPANIMLEKGDQPRVTDFGLAVSVGEGDTRITHDGQVMGTPVYMSPEQASGRLEHVGPKSDIYALGAVLYEMLTGRPPFRDGPAATVIYDIVYNSPTAIRSLAPEVAPDLTYVCMRAMEPDPRHRYPTMDAFAADLERFLVGEPVSARAPSWASRGRAWMRRNRTFSVAAGAALGATAVAATLWGVVAAHAAEVRATRESAAAHRVTEANEAIRELDRAGDHAAARRAFADLIAQPDVQGTSSWTNAWLAEAARRAEAGDDDGERDALGRVWLNGEDPQRRRLALTRIAGTWRSDLQYDRVGLALAALDQERGAAAPSLSERLLGAEAALFRWDTEGVDHPAAPMVAALASRTPVVGAIDDAVLDRGRPGSRQPALLRARDGSRAWLLRATGETKELPALAPGERFVRLFRADAEDLHALVYSGSTLRVLRLDDTWTEEGRAEVPDLNSCDVTSMGEAEPLIVVSSNVRRSVALFQVGPTGRWTLSAPLWPREALNSDYGGAVTTDLDADGARELVVGLGAWGAYDVRLYQPVDGRMRLRTRTRLGEVVDPSAFRLASGAAAVAVGSRGEYRSRRIFRDDAPFEGVAVLALKEDHLDVVHRVAAPHGCAVMGTGDADGDGLDDIVAECLDSTLFIRQAGDRLASVAVADLQVRGVADLDGDGTIEVLAREPGPDGARLVIAGLAGPARPPLPAPTIPAVEAPANLDQTARITWQREETLAALGLGRSAVDLLTRPAAEMDGVALLRRAQIEAGGGLYEEAARSATTAAAAADAPEGALARASELARDAIDPEAARALLGVDARAPDPEIHQLAGLGKVELRFDEALDPRWNLLDPSAMRREQADGTLRLEPHATRVAARLPLDVAGGLLRLEVEMDVELTDWDGAARFLLVPEGATELEAPIDLVVRGEGGGGTLATTVESVFAGIPVGSVRTEPLRKVATTQGRLHLVAAADAVTGRIRARVEVDHDPILLRASAPLTMPAVPAGRYDLVITGGSKWSPNARFVGHLRRITVDGATIGTGPVAASGVAQAIHELVSNRADAALSALHDHPGPAADEVRMWALLDLGRGAEAATLYRTRLARGPVDAALLDPVRTRPRWAVEGLRQTLGARWSHYAWQVWRAPVFQLPDDPEIGREFIAWAEDLVEPGPGASEADQLEYFDICVHIARAARAQGRLSLATALLDRTVNALRPSAADEETRSVLLAEAETELARVAAIRGEADPLRTSLRLALEAHPAPETLAEVLSVDPLFDEARRSSWWTPLVEPFRRYGVRAAGR